jgi:putative phosphoribosyl transferase
VAVPVAASEGVRRLEAAADEVVCAHAVSGGFAVGAYYDDFHQLTDAEVSELLTAG